MSDRFIDFVNTWLQPGSDNTEPVSRFNGFLPEQNR